MTLADLRSAVVFSQPIDDSEVTPELLERAIKKAFKDLNKYKPKKKHLMLGSGTYIISGNEMFLAAYETTSLLLPDYNRPATHKLDDNGLLTCYGPTYLTIGVRYEDLDDIVGESIEERMIDLTGLWVKSYCANIRRTAIMNDIPFDLRGQEFYEEFKEERSKYLEDLQASETGF